MAPNIPEALIKEGLFFVKPALAAKVSVPKPNFKWGNEWLRWNLLWFIFFCVLFIPLPFWLFPLTCLGGFIANCVVTIWQMIALFACLISGSRIMRKMYHADTVNWPVDPSVIHIVVLTGYKEPLEVMCQTIDSLKKQTVAHQLFVLVGLEERTPDFEFKKVSLIEKYKHDFKHIMVTQHPFAIPGEIPGKCSNSNYALREAVRQLKLMGWYDKDKCIVTTCDTDNPFSPKYFEYLGWDFCRAENRKEVVWQAPLVYNLELDKRPFFVRVTGILRAVFMMGILIPQSMTTMSIFSMSLELMEKGFVHPGYQMDDIINIVRRMIHIHKLVKVRVIPYPVISGPTSGQNLKEETVEWTRQARRWTIGAAEVFHYLCIKWGQYDTWSGIVYAVLFTHYYGFIICGMSLFNFTSLIASSIYYGTGVCYPDDFLFHENFVYFPLIGVAFGYVFFAWAFIMDALTTRLLKMKEDISVLRNLFHWVLSPLVLLAYSFIEYYAIIEVAIFGKSVCHHGASKKDGLVQKV